MFRQALIVGRRFPICMVTVRGSVVEVSADNIFELFLYRVVVYLSYSTHILGDEWIKLFFLLLSGIKFWHCSQRIWRTKSKNRSKAKGLWPRWLSSLGKLPAQGLHSEQVWIFASFSINHSYLIYFPLHPRKVYWMSSMSVHVLFQFANFFLLWAIKFRIILFYEAFIPYTMSHHVLNVIIQEELELGNWKPL